MLNKAVKLDDIDKTIVPLKKFKIIGTIEEGRQHQKTDEYRVRKKFYIFPCVFVGFEAETNWTGKWFSFIEIKEQKIRERYSDFDSGWSYQSYWKEWKDGWKIIEVIKNKNGKIKNNRQRISRMGNGSRKSDGYYVGDS